MISIAVMQPYFFPYIGYWQLIDLVDRFIILDDVNYIVRGWINRNRILINGEPRYISAPLNYASQNKLICNSYLQSSPIWKKKMIKTVEFAYRKAPFFVEVFPVIDELLNIEEENLSDYLTYQIKRLSYIMGINTEFLISSHSYKKNDLVGENRIIDICKKENASIYVNAPSGASIYSPNLFLENGIELQFINPFISEYKQFSPVFEPSLSIIDVLMFNGWAGTKLLLDKRDIKKSFKRAKFSGDLIYRMIS